MAQQTKQQMTNEGGKLVGYKPWDKIRKDWDSAEEFQINANKDLVAGSAVSYRR